MEAELSPENTEWFRKSVMGMSDLGPGEKTRADRFLEHVLGSAEPAAASLETPTSAASAPVAVAQPVPESAMKIATDLLVKHDMWMAAGTIEVEEFVVRELFQSLDPVHRQAAALAVGEMGAQGAPWVPALCAQIGREGATELEVICATASLGALAARDVTPALAGLDHVIGAMSHPDKDVRATAFAVIPSLARLVARETGDNGHNDAERLAGALNATYVGMADLEDSQAHRDLARNAAESIHDAQELRQRLQPLIDRADDASLIEAGNRALAAAIGFKPGQRSSYPASFES